MKKKKEYLRIFESSSKNDYYMKIKGRPRNIAQQP